MKITDIIAQTKRLMAIPSTADNPAALHEATDFVADLVRAGAHDVTIERFERNGKPSFLAYAGPTRPEKFDILLNGHVDVVPAKPEQFKPYEKDGKLYGRGALDMKGTATVLASVFAELVHEVPYALGLQIVSDEEVGGYDGVSYQIKEGVRADFVIMGEYANHRHTIYNAARGICWAEIRFRGKSAHGGHLWHGTNAVVKAGDFAGAVLRHYPTPDKETWTTTASIAQLSTPNEAYNRVPDSAVLKIDFRFTQEDPVFESRESLERFIHTIDPEAELVNLATFEPAVNVGEMNPYVRGLSAALKQVTQKRPRFLGRPASSDGRHFALVGNDIVEFGLYGLHSHADDEFVELNSFGEYRDVMRAFLRAPRPATMMAKESVEPLAEKLLRKLVEMPTAGDRPTATYAALAFVEDFLRSRGMHIRVFERNGYRSIIATTLPDAKSPTVLLNAHIDTVPASDGYKLTLKDGKFYGRGVMDMKHAIAAYLTLVDNLQHELSDYDFGIMITSDEEVGSRNGAKPLVQEEGYLPKVIIVPDGGNNWELERFAKGVYWIKLNAAGKTAHASRPWEGDSAIRRLLSALQEIERLVAVNPKPTDTLLSVGTIEGGVSANQLAANASAMLDIRTGSAKEHRDILERILSICKAHGVTTETLVNDPPCETDPDGQFVKPMVDIVTEVTGARHDTSYDYGVNDSRFFNAAGVPTIVINPECGGIHSDDEWLSRTGFAQFSTVLERYVRQMAAVKDKTPMLDVAELAERLNAGDKPAYVWYATYGSGLSKENFMCQVRGGSPEGSSRVFAGCTDKTPPIRDEFISLPYALYFAGDCAAWGGGGHINVLPEPSASAHTVGRAYLITAEQFEEIVAQQNDRIETERLPLAEAMKHGHTMATKNHHGDYEELVYCGQKDGFPVFTLTAAQPQLPYVPPSPVYARLLCKGLSENADIDRESAIKYMLDVPGIAGNYGRQQISKLFADAEKPVNAHETD